MTTKQAWAGFWALAVIWGSSFLLIRVGVAQVPPFQLVFLRTAIAALGFHAVLALRGLRLPDDLRRRGDLLMLGVVNTVVPFALITWGETRVESGLTSVLQGTAALFTMVLAHFAFVDERITPRKLTGLLVGFLGVVVLAGRSTMPGTAPGGVAGQLLGQAAIIGASLCYGIGGVYGRRAMQRQLDPMVVAAGAMTVAALLSGLIAWASPALGMPGPVSLGQLSPAVLGAVLALGVVNTFGAYLIFYPLMAVLGATRTSMVTYVIPVVGVLLGAFVLDERVDLLLLIGMALILGSIAIVNLNLGALMRRPAARVSAERPVCDET
jgi:drug/metabolite transporter (DMT)-like permease